MRSWAVASVLLVALGSGAGAHNTAVSPAAPPSQQSTGVLTLSRAVSEALACNDLVLAARDGVAQTSLALLLARSTFRPKITPGVMGSLGQSDAANQAYNIGVTQRFLTGAELRGTVGVSSYQNQIGRFYGSDVTVSLSQPLLRGFGSTAASRDAQMAETAAASATRNLAVTERRLAIDVAAAYYGVRTQQQLIKVSEQGLERAALLLDASEAKMRAGRVSQLDVLRAKQLVAGARDQLGDARSALEDAIEQLASLIGRPTSDVRLADGDIPASTDVVNVDGAVAAALAHRPELDDLRAKLADADRALTVARSHSRPQLDVGVSVTRRQTSSTIGASFGLDKFEFMPFVGFSAPGDRTPVLLALSSASIERSRLERDMVTLTRRIESEVRTAVRQQARALRRIESAKGAIELADKEVELATFRYQRGLSNNQDLVSAEAGLLSARAQQWVVMAEAAVAALWVRFAVGSLDPRTDVR